MATAMPAGELTIQLQRKKQNHEQSKITSTREGTALSWLKMLCKKGGGTNKKQRHVVAPRSLEQPGQMVPKALGKDHRPVHFTLAQ